jgi:hypothetical protein
MKLKLFMLAAALAGLVSKPAKIIYKGLFPIGYEDEMGFHYGRPKRQR